MPGSRDPCIKGPHEDRFEQLKYRDIAFCWCVDVHGHKAARGPWVHKGGNPALRTPYRLDSKKTNNHVLRPTYFVLWLRIKLHCKETALFFMRGNGRLVDN